MNELRRRIDTELKEIFEQPVIRKQKVDAVLDAVIAALPEVRDIAGDDDWTMGHSDGQHDYKKKALTILQAAKESK